MEVALDPKRTVDIFDAYFRFNPCFHGSSSRSFSQDDEKFTIEGFNPCFHGSSSRSLTKQGKLADELGFNPCFHGSSSRSRLQPA